MKISNLKRGQLFKFGKQKNFRTFQESRLLSGKNIPTEHVGKLLVIYDNCKQMICDPETEVTVEVNFLEPVKGFGKCYSTGIEKLSVVINGFKTNISHFLKDGHRLLYVYSIMDKTGSYIELDVRTIKDFPKVSHEIMLANGINILFNDITSNESAYAHLF